jgi:hypothetical protein
MKLPLYDQVPVAWLSQFNTWSAFHPLLLKKASDEQSIDVHDMPKVIENLAEIEDEAKAELQTIETKRQSMRLELNGLLRRRNALLALIGKPH